MKNQEIKTAIKIFSLGLLGGVFCFFLFRFFDQFLVTLDFTTLWVVLIFTGLFFSVFILQTFFIRDKLLLIATALLQGLLPLAAFYPYIENNNFLLFIGLAVIIFAGSLIAGAKSGFNNLSNGIKIHFFSIANSVITKGILGLLLVLITVSYFYLFHLGNFDNDAGKVVFDRAIESSEPIVDVWFPGVTFDLTTSEALKTMTDTELERSKIRLLQQGVDYSRLPISIQQEMRQEIYDEISLTLENVTGQEIIEEQSLGDYFFNALSGWLNSFSVAMQEIFKIGILVILLFMLKGLSFLFYVPVQAFSFLIFKALILAGFADVILQNASKEEIAI